MKFTIRNLGPLRDASVELGNFTVVCGKNNCGKTYLAYTLDTFLDTIKYNLYLPLHQPDLDALFEKGGVQIDLRKYIDDFINLVQNTVPEFTKALPRFLAMVRERFADTQIDVPLTQGEVFASLADGKVSETLDADAIVRLTNTSSLAIRRFPDPMTAQIVLFNTSSELPPVESIQAAIGLRVAHLFNASLSHPLFPESFIITSERTGAALFRADLMGVKFRQDQVRAQNTEQIPTGYKGYGYQRPVEKDIEFVLELKRFLPHRSFLAEKHPEILNFFSTIAGGTYDFDETTDRVVFKPQNALDSISLAESSSTVRSLAELHFYLNHIAKPGQMLMMDEPEINLHPENQRKLARLFAMLVKAGLRVFITTHSDYIVREINVLLRMNALERENASQLAHRHGYLKGEELSPGVVKVFVLRNGYTEEVLFNSDNHVFGVPSFDDTIAKFNAVYRDLMDIGL